METEESPLALAELHVREAEERVVRQAEIVRKLDEAGQGRAAREAEASLAVVRTTLAIARANLSFVRMLPDGPGAWGRGASASPGG